ncbi:VOC family protein [Cellulomonas iranensis]|uniref:VOC family protein n=1 Tax=Cellulomonas iranensis TaxID=76862 RepID=UPI000B3C55F8|nr:VOC family protein [Cellulomonas iranensis]
MKIAQVAQHAGDLDRAQTFYTELLGTQPVGRVDPAGLLFYAVGDTRLMLDLAAPSSVLYLEVTDLPGRVEQLRAHGVVVENEPHVIFEHQDDSLGPAGSAEWQAFVRDSEGNLVGLVEHVTTTT